MNRTKKHTAPTATPINIGVDVIHPAEGALISKNKSISDSLKTTRDRRKNQECKAFELKADKSHFSKTTGEQVKRVFLEAKWLYNYTLAQESVFKVSDKLKEVDVKVKDDMEKRELSLLGSQMKQSVIKGIQQNIYNLSKAKKKGIKVGRLNYISRYESIDLKQYGVTYRIQGNRIKVQGITQWFRVRGLEQLKGYEIANAKFIQKSGNYYFRVAGYKLKEEQIACGQAIGIDFGIKTQLTLSDGLCGLELLYDWTFPKRLRKIAQGLSRKEEHSANWYKQQILLRKEYERWNNRKKDVRNKVIHNLLKFNYICYQDDNFRGWQRIWGKRILSTAIGGITARLKQSATSVKVDRFYPSTKKCPVCNHLNDIGLEERTFMCVKCNYTAPRDWKSATDIRNEALNSIGVEYTEYTPAEIESSTLCSMLDSFKAIPHLKASLVAGCRKPPRFSEW